MNCEFWYVKGKNVAVVFASPNEKVDGLRTATRILFCPETIPQEQQFPSFQVSASSSRILEQRISHIAQFLKCV